MKRIDRTSRRWAVAVAIIIALGAAGWAALHGVSKAIPYDRDRWLAADEVSGSERYRMAESLIRKARQER